ncbi:MAG: LytTR family DNA-binding domain-containing protein [Pricia sp.]
MRKDRLYFLTFLAISVLFIGIAGIAVHFFVRASAHQLLAQQLESSRTEAKEIARLAGYQLESGLDQQTVVQNVQKSIQNTNLESLFVSMFDWSGTEICNPDITKVGRKVSANESLASTIDNKITSEDFYDLLMAEKTENDGDDSGNAEMDTEIIYLYPVSNSDWIIGVHANIAIIANKIRSLRNEFYVIVTIMGFVLILSSVITVRLIGSVYEKRLEAEKEVLQGEVFNLAKLNKALDRYQQKVGEALAVAETSNGAETKTEKGKKRILTYLRHELLPVPIEEIAYIYTENTITYVVDIHGKRSTVNNSLEELYDGLDSNFFYRANRQFIIAISSIEKIIRFGKNKLKILMVPECELDIIIGKNKAAEFKQWLNL